VTKPYKLVSREFQNENTVVKVGNVLFGDGSMPVISGPCAIEGEEQAITIAKAVKKAGAAMFRGGAFKPRTSPYDFQGLGKQGLEILAKVREETGLPVATEVMDIDNFDLVEEYADVIQIGTRNMQNFSLLKRAGRSTRPVILKRGMSAMLQEWLMAAEYIMEEGNSQVIMCERGIRTFVRHSRNTLDLSVVIAVKKESHLPVIIDPSHAAGVRDQVIPLACASVAAGADGLMIEVHHKPDEAMSDGAQSLYPEQFEKLMEMVNKIHAITGVSRENH
jgi:3-deoxy-7-phosphoheptulonate synthase